MKATKEADVLRDCLAYLRLHRLFCWRSNNAGVRRTDAKTGRQWHQFSGLRGVADIIGILSPTGRLLAIECKSATGKLSEEQAAFLDAVRLAGGVSFVARSVADVERALRLEGVLKS